MLKVDSKNEEIMSLLSKVMKADPGRILTDKKGLYHADGKNLTFSGHELGPALLGQRKELVDFLNQRATELGLVPVNDIVHASYLDPDGQTKHARSEDSGNTWKDE